MPRTARASVGAYCYHVINRGNARAQVFHKDADYHAFVDAMTEANVRLTVRVLAYCLMPNHFHLVIRPEGDGELGRWMHWLLTTHVRRYLRHYHHTGHVRQGRFKAFPILDDDHLVTVRRYVERNPSAPTLSPAPRIGLGQACEPIEWDPNGQTGRRRGKRIGSTSSMRR